MELFGGNSWEKVKNEAPRFILIEWYGERRSTASGTFSRRISRESKLDWLQLCRDNEKP